MAKSGFQQFQIGGVPIVVAFKYIDGFTAVEIGNAWTRDEEKDAVLTDAQRERFEAWIMEHRSRRDQNDNAEQSALYDPT